MADSINWKRPCTQLESLFHMLQHSSGSMLTCYTLTLATLQPLTLQHVNTALRHLYRKVPLLRLTILPKDDNSMWFVELDQEKIDLEAITSESIEETIQKLSTTPTSGPTEPLWRVRFAPLNKQSEDGRFMYKLLFGFNHSFTDGYSTFRITGHFMNLLNDSLSGNAIDDTEQLCTYHNTEDPTMQLVHSFFSQWQEKPEEKEKLWEFFKQIKTARPQLLDAYPQTDKSVAPATLSLRHDFSTQQTRSFLALCKEHAVSCHEAFFTATQLALVEMLKAKGDSSDSHELVTNHTINNRRYYPKDLEGGSKRFGLSISVLPTRFTVPKDATKSFWKTCQDYAKTFKSGLENHHSLKMSVFLLEAYTKDPSLLMQTVPKESYLTSNMGECTEILTGNFAKSDPEPEEKKLATMTDITRRVSSHSEGIILSHLLQTFKGRLLYSMDYNVHHLATVDAEAYRDCLVKIIAEITGCN